MAPADELLKAVRDLTAAVSALADAQPRDAYRLPAAAARLGISEVFLRRLIKAGRVRPVPHMGAVVLIAQCELDRVVGNLPLRAVAS